MTMRILGVCVCLWSLASLAMAQADNSAGKSKEELEAEIQRLRALVAEQQQVMAKQQETMSDVMKRIDKLEATKESQDKAGINKVKLEGDFRYRLDYEHTNPKNSSISGVHAPFGKPETPNDRFRHRLRLRLGGEFEVNDTWTFGARLATSVGGDPIRYNQTLSEGFSKKDIWLDLAYFDFHPPDLPGFKLQGGKIRNPFYTPGATQLIWDTDLTPEGLAVTYQKTGLGSWTLTGTAGYFQVQERSVDRDSQLLGLQATAKYDILEKGRANVLLGLSYYDYINTKGYPPLYTTSDNFGNSLSLAIVDGLSNNAFYADDYNLIEAFSEVTFPVWDIPASVFGDFVYNTTANDTLFDTDEGAFGWSAGLQLGKCAAPDSWALRYEYRDLGRNAVLGVYTDSEFGGGGTNTSGHIVSAEYMPYKNVRLGLRYIINENRGSEWLRLLSGGWGAKENVNGLYQRFQLDLNLKF